MVFLKEFFITDSRIRSIICKGPKYRFPVPINFKSCPEEIAGALQEFCNRWCKREHVESNALNISQGVST